MPNAIVTGGAQGIGFTTIVHLLKEGFNVAIFDLQTPTMFSDELKNLLSTHSKHLRYYHCDIRNIEQHSQLLAQVNHDFGTISCLVNNAGIAVRPLTDILSVDPKDFDLSVDINLRGTFFLTQLVANQMLEHGMTNTHRSIIFITSVAAQLISTNRSQYCITKSALSTTAKLFAKRLAEHHIYVHEIRPGFTKTAMTQNLGRTVVDEWIENGRVPLKRWGTADEVAQTVITLANGLLPFTTGHVFWVDGGLNLQEAPSS